MERIDLLKNDGYWQAVIECGLEDGNLVGVVLNLKNELVKLIEAREYAERMAILKKYFAGNPIGDVFTEEWEREVDDYWESYTSTSTLNVVEDEWMENDFFV